MNRAYGDTTPAPMPRAVIERNLREEDAAALRRGLWEIAGMAILALVAMAFLGFSRQAVIAVAAALAVMLAFTFILKAPSLETLGVALASAVWRAAPAAARVLRKLAEGGLRVAVLSERRDFDAQTEAAFILIFDRAVSPARDNVIDCFAGSRPIWKEWRDRCVFKGILLPGARGGGLRANPSIKSSADAWRQWIAPSNKMRLDPYTGRLRDV